MRSLVAACLRGRVVVVGLAALLMGGGIISASRASLDAFPEFAPPRVEVQTEAPGLSSLEVETLVTTPLEAALAGASFSRAMRSKSVLGLSSVVVLFAPDTDPFIARQLVQERIARVVLPLTARTPVVLPPLSSTSRALKIGLTSATRSQAELTDVVRWTVRPRLLAIPGVANVAVWGARERELDVRLDLGKLDAFNLTVDEITRALKATLTPVAGGFVDGPLQRFAVQHTQPTAIADLAIATRGGAPIRVRDVATVEDTFAQPIGDAVVNDVPGLLLIVEKQPWGSTLDITHGVDAALRAMALQDITVDAAIFRPASFIERAIGNLTEAMLIGCLLVIGVLVLFLWSWRTALISAVAIPLSIAAALIFLPSLNTMVLAGLVIALGEIVDDAIIDVENISRRLRERGDTPALGVVLAASLEVRSAVVYATAIVILVFLPVWFLDGVAGAFFRPLAMAYGLAVLASLGVALTLTPALCLMLLPNAEHRRSPVMEKLQDAYARWLPALLDRPRQVMAGAGAALVLTVVGFGLLGSGFLPDFRENDFLMHWVAQPGTSLHALQRTTLRISKELRAIPGVTSFGAHLGRAEAADEIVGPNFAELWVHATDHGVEGAIQQAIAHYPGLRRDVETYLRERIAEVVSGGSAPIIVRSSGPDLLVLRKNADALAQRLSQVKGVASVQVEQQAMVPELRVDPRPEAAALGFLGGDIKAALSTLVRGQAVGEMIDAGRTVPIVVRGPDALRDDASALRQTLLVSATGAKARLGDVATVTLLPAPNVVPHEAGLRKIDIALTVSADLGSVAAAVEQAVAGSGAQVLGEWQERQAASRRLAWLSVLSLLLVVGVLYVDLKSRAWLVAASLPFALVGGVAGAWLTGGVLSLGSLVGLVTVLGIASRNAILLMSHYPAAPDRAAIIRASSERLGPIVMTALATGLALLPLVIAGDAPGHEIEHPMAVVILGGLVSSTLLNLIVLPVAFSRTTLAASRSV